MDTNSVDTDPLAAARAVALWAYIHERSARFSTDDAQAVIRDVSALLGGPIKKLARKLRYALAERGVAIKHSSALQAAARVQHLTDWHQARRAHDGASPAMLEVFAGPSLETQTHTGWRSALGQVERSCLTWLAEHPSSKVVAIQLGRTHLQFSGLMFDASDGKIAREPSPDVIAFIKPVESHHENWLAGATGPLEALRRGLEQTGRAVLDGYAVVRLASDPYGAASTWPMAATTVYDAANSELVLMREDYEGTDGFEVMRGSELACWHQFERALEDVRSGAVEIDEETGAWRCGPARFVWEITTLRPDDVVPGLWRRLIGRSESNALLHRYRQAKAILSAKLPAQEVARHLDAFSGLPPTCRLLGHPVLTALTKAGLTWEAFCAEQGVDLLPLQQPIPTELFLSLAVKLDLAAPFKFIAPPSRGDLVRAEDDQLLRALVHRVHWVRYRKPAELDAERASAVKDAVEEFSASLQLRHGVFQMADSLQQLVYAEDAAEMLGRLKEVGLTAYVGVMPHVARMTEEQVAAVDAHRKRAAERAAAENWPFQPPEPAPFYFGHALFLDIDWTPNP